MVYDLGFRVHGLALEVYGSGLGVRLTTALAGHSYCLRDLATGPAAVHSFGLWFRFWSL